MKKNIVKKLKLTLLTLVACFSLVFAGSRALQNKSEKNKSIAKSSFTGYGRFVKAGSVSYGIGCGETLIVFVDDDSNEINTGVEVWRNHTLSIHLGNGIITSQSGSTNGMSFYVTDGIIGEEADPC